MGKEDLVNIYIYIYIYTHIGVYWLKEGVLGDFFSCLYAWARPVRLPLTSRRLRCNSYEIYVCYEDY